MTSRSAHNSGNLLVTGSSPDFAYIRSVSVAEGRYPNREDEARVRRVEPAGFLKVSALGVEEQRVNVIADFVSPKEDWQRLGDGYRVEARFVIWEDEDVLQVPASSLFRVNGGWALFVVENGPRYC